LLHEAMAGGALPGAAVIVLSAASGVLTALLLAYTGTLSRRDAIIYGN